MRKRAQDRPLWVRIWCAVFFAGIVIQFCPPVLAGEPVHVSTVSSPTIGADHASHIQAVDTDSGVVNCCHIELAHAIGDATLFFVASDTDLRVPLGAVTEHYEIFSSSTPDSATFSASTLDDAAVRGRTLYLTTRRLRI